MRSPPRLRPPRTAHSLSRVGAGHLLPGGTVPVQGQGLDPGAGDDFSHGPGVTVRGGRDHAYPVELVEGVARAGARDRVPYGAVPVLDQGLTAGAVAGRADGPDAGRRGGADAVEEVVAAAGIGAVHLRPREPVPVLDQGLVRPPAEVEARR